MSKRTSSQAELTEGPMTRSRRRVADAVDRLPVDHVNHDCGQCPYQAIIEKYADPDYIPTKSERQQAVVFVDVNHVFNAEAYKAKQRLCSLIAAKLSVLAGKLRIMCANVTGVTTSISGCFITFELHERGPNSSATLSLGHVLSRPYYWDALARHQQQQKQKEQRPRVVMSALHPRVGADSSLQRASQQPLFDRNVLRVIFAMMQ